MNSNTVSPIRSTSAGSQQTPRWLHGVIPPLITPFTINGDVDYSALRGLVDHLIGAGVHGLFVLGSTGETAYLTNEERLRVATVVIEHTAGRVPVLVGCIDMTAPRVVVQATQAQTVGADAVVASAPFYAINDNKEIAAHFRTISDAIDIPLIAYSVPVRSHAALDVETVLALGREHVIAGLKDSSGDDVGFRRLVLANRDAGSPLALFTGHECVCDALALVGADGLVPGLANVDPAGYLRLWQAAERGDWASATAEQDRLTRLFGITVAASGRSADARGVGAFKTAMAHMGTLPHAGMAPPVQQLTEDEIAAVTKVVEEWRTGCAASVTK
jgi:4-hydroxy-tetrahydrodipicolinate synthase